MGNRLPIRQQCPFSSDKSIFVTDKKILAKMSDTECTTDALPSPPRDQKEKTFQNYQKTDTNSKNKSKNASPEEPKQTPNRKHTENEQRPTTNNIQINVVQSTGVHIGSINKFIFGDSNKTSKKEIIESKEIKTFKSKMTPVTIKDITLLSKHIGEGWKVTARKLMYSEGLIEQIEHNRKLQEAVYQFLLDWIRNSEPDKALVGVLADTLWNTDQKEAVKIWVENYKSINK